MLSSSSGSQATGTPNPDRLSPLETHLQRQLHDPREVLLRRGHPAEAAAARTGVRTAEPRVIERVECFTAELRLDPFPDPEVLEDPDGRFIHAVVAHVS